MDAGVQGEADEDHIRTWIRHTGVVNVTGLTDDKLYSGIMNEVEFLMSCAAVHAVKLK